MYLSPRRRSTRPSTSRFPQNQNTDRVVDVSVAIKRKVSQNPPTHRQIWRNRLNKWIWIGPPIQRTYMLTFSETLLN